METLKIAMVSDWFFPSVGGVEIHIHDLSSRLQEMGHEVHIITGNRDGEEKDVDTPYQVHRIKGISKVPRFNVWVGTRKPMEELFKSEKFDVVHAHSFYSPMALEAGLVSHSLNMPYLLTFHSFLDTRAIPKILSIAFTGYTGKRGVLFRVIRNSHLVAVSNAVRKNIVRMLKVEDSMVHTIPNGIDTDFWRPQTDRGGVTEKKENDAVTVLTVSRLTRRKRVQSIPKIIKALHKYSLNSGVRFVIVGSGPLKRALQRYAKKETGLYLIDCVDRQKLHSIYESADLYLSPSKKEAFGIAVAEAQSMMLPAVALNHGGAAEIVIHNTTGYVASTDAELTEYLATLIDDEVTRLRMGREARKHAVRRFSWKLVTKRVLRVYELAMEGKA